MPKKQNESFLDYKKRVMDKISPSYCAAKWYNATIWLQGGYTTSCHNPLPYKVHLKEVEKNPAALHNTFEKIMDRRLMLNGRRPPGCVTCWKIEDLNNPEIISDRVYKTMIYSDEDIEYSHTCGRPHENYIPRFLEISFSSACNLACAYCNASFSTKWIQDIKQFGFYSGISDENSEKINHAGEEFVEFSSDINPYIKAFWQWWPDLITKLEELRLTGGEPLLSDDTWKIIGLFKDKQYANINLAINSNLAVSKELIEKLDNEAKNINIIDLYTSCEAVGRQAEYIRDGLVYASFIKNLKYLIAHKNFRSINMMLTINALSLFSLVDFLDVLLDIKKEFNSYMPVWTLNIIKFPSFLIPLVLPSHIRNDIASQLSCWIEKNMDEPFITDMEKNHIYRLVEYLKQADPEGQNKLQKDFKNFFLQYDQRRKKNITSTFPQLFTNWFQKL